MFKTLHSLVIIAAASAALVVPFTASSVKAASVLLYNGDADPSAASGNYFNGFNTGSSGAIYQGFTVPNTADWVIDSVFSNNLMNFTAPSAFWEIRSGVAANTPGTFIAGSQSSPVTQVATNRPVPAGNSPEYTITVSGLNVILTPGNYWIAVAPNGTGGASESLLSATSGGNSVGRPASSTGSSFFNSPTFTFRPISALTDDPNHTNYSIGFTGTVTAPTTPVPFEFSPTLGIVILGSWAALNKVKPSKRKS